MGLGKGRGECWTGRAGILRQTRWNAEGRSEGKPSTDGAMAFPRGRRWDQAVGVPLLPMASTGKPLRASSHSASSSGVVGCLWR